MPVTNIGAQTRPTPLRRHDGLSAVDILNQNSPEYVMEVGEVGCYLFAACLFTTLLQHPATAVRQFVSSGFARRILGVGMGMTTIAVVMSP